MPDPLRGLDGALEGSWILVIVAAAALALGMTSERWSRGRIPRAPWLLAIVPAAALATFIWWSLARGRTEYPESMSVGVAVGFLLMFGAAAYLHAVLCLGATLEVRKLPVSAPRGITQALSLIVWAMLGWECVALLLGRGFLR